MRGVKWFGMFMFRVLLSCFAILLAFYFPCEISNPLPSKPFSGTQWFNPYQNLDRHWYKASFHTHTIEWGGVTNGHQYPSEVFQAYQSKGYDALAISNYKSILHRDSFPSGIHSLPAYEHGYNIFKSHLLALGAKKVSYWDFPLWQSRSMQQTLIHRLRACGEVVVMAHPAFFGGRRLQDMPSLGGYDCMEVMSHYRNSQPFWDAALSAGRLPWLIVNDDTHDIYREATFVCWTMLNTDSCTEENLLHALKTGKTIGVNGKEGLNHNMLKEVRVQQDTLLIRCEKNADSIFLISDGGKRVAAKVQSDFIQFQLTEEHTYVRAQIWNSETCMLLNPIVRTETGNPPILSTELPEVSLWKTWMFRIGILLLCLSLLYLAILKKW